MENSKHLIVGVLAGLVVLVGAVALIHPVVNVAPAQVSVNAPDQSVGAISSPDLSSSYFSFGGVRQWAKRAQIVSGVASTTVCAIQSPAASSTPTFIGFHANTGTATAMTLRVSKQTSQWPNATVYRAQTALSANTDTAVIATSTDIGDILGSSVWLVYEIKVTGGGAGTSSPTGNCSASFREI